MTLDVLTPALVVDLDRLEANLARWQDHCDRAGLANRPHVKTHKCVEIARRQVALGARGITCQTLHEAEVMVDAGIDDVLVPYNVVGEPKLERLASLLGRAHLRVSVDDAALLAGLSGAAGRAGRELGVLVDCDTGLGRTGVGSPGEAAGLADEIARTPGLRFDGLLTFPSPPGAHAFLEEAAARIRSGGLEVETVSAGGTPTMWSSGGLRPLVTEYRAGTYAFNDRNTIRAGAASLDQVALTVAATVVSRRNGRVIVDAGSKALSSEAAGRRVRPGPGVARGAHRAAGRGARLRRAGRRRRARARTAGADRPQPRLPRRQPRRRAGGRSRPRDHGALACRAWAVITPPPAHSLPHRW